MVKVAAFDMDDTIIKPSSGKVFATDDPKDFAFVHKNVPTYLHDLHERGFLVVLVSNQSGVARGGVFNAKKAAALQEKIVIVSKQLEVPLVAYIATREDRWRKPNTALWGLMQEGIEAVAGLPAGTPIDCNRYAFYVGDAAGREGLTLANRKKDFSCSDRKFAHNLAIPFLTPEQFFLAPTPERLFVDENEEAAAGVGSVLSQRYLAEVASQEKLFSWDGPSPSELRALPTSYAGLMVQCTRSNGTTTSTTLPNPPQFARPGTQELVLFIGFPSCGKTTFYRRFFEPYGYVHVNADTLKSKAKCVSATATAWAAGKSVVVDNTNPTAADRQLYTAVVTRHQSGKGGSGSRCEPVPIRAIVFTHSLHMASHLNRLRARLGLAAALPAVAYNVFRSKYTPLTAADLKTEGFEEMVEIPPVADFSGLPAAARKEFFVLS